MTREPTRPVAPAELAGCLRTEVSRLAYHLRSPATASGVTPTRLAALSALARHDEGMRAGDLAAEMHVSPPTTTRLIDILVGEGWVARERDPDDARAMRLVLTDHGRATLEGLRHESTSRLAEDLAALDPADRDLLARAVPVLRAIADRRLGPLPERH